MRPRIVLNSADSAPVLDPVGEPGCERVRQSIVAPVDLQELFVVRTSATPEFTIDRDFVQNVQKRAEPCDWRGAKIHHA